MAFGNLPDLKLYLGIKEADVQEDAALSNLLVQVSGMIEDYCNRPLTEGTKFYDEIYSGDGSAFLVLRNRPVYLDGLLSVWMDDNASYNQASGAFSSNTKLVLGTDYVLQTDVNLITSQCGILQNLSSAWDVFFSYMPTVIYPLIQQPPSYGAGNIRCQYTAGYASLPQQLYLALYGQIATVRNSKNYGQILGSESISDGAGSNNYSIKKESKIGWLTPETRSILAKFPNVAVA